MPVGPAGIGLVKDVGFGGGPHGREFCQFVVGKLVDEIQLAGHAVVAGPIGVGGDAVGPRRAAGRAAARQRPAGPAVDVFVEARDRIVAARCS